MLYTFIYALFLNCILQQKSYLDRCTTKIVIKYCTISKCRKAVVLKETSQFWERRSFITYRLSFIILNLSTFLLRDVFL